MDHVDLLLSISELNHVLHEETPVRDYLDRCVVIIAHHFNAEVCSIYLYDPIQKRINLASTTIIGINISKISLDLGEGLTGLALKELRPIMSSESSKHPNYRYFPDLHEENFEAYLGVPIIHGIERIGVLVVQRSRSRPFEETDLKSLRGVANQIAAMIDYARLLIHNNQKKIESSNQGPHSFPSFIKGRSASAGWAFGPVVAYGSAKDFSTLPPEVFVAEKTIDDFNAATQAAIARLARYQDAIEERLADAASLIFKSHIMLLQDEQFAGKIRTHIQAGTHPAKALVKVAQNLISFFAKQENPYFRQKADDIRDIAFQVLSSLVPESFKNYSFENKIVASSDLMPSDMLILSAAKAAGTIVIGGGATSHVAILARSLKLPMVIADAPALLNLPDGSTALIDAESGNIFINPKPAVLSPYEMRINRHKKRTKVDTSTFPHATSDGTSIEVLANVNLISDVADARAVNATGIGLYRTEFPFIIRNTFPNEEEQCAVYQKLVRGMNGFPVTFRTLDIGGDKALSQYAEFKENNPFLGLRSMRFCLEYRDVFKSQIRAILRAGSGTNLRIMFPMISSVDELLEARSIVAECMSELAMEQVDFLHAPPIGIMVELPATLDIIDDLAKKADFFSIGTNDLIQYLLAVDRTNEKVAKYYCPHHPAVLRAIKRIADAAQKAGIGCSVCGDMAHDSRYVEFMIGTGIRTLSIDPLYFPTVCASLKKMTVAHASEKARKLLLCSTISETEAIFAGN
jgi:phosphotransferase system, enzyme I, PtsP